jgi:hypothetical protein
VSKVKKRDGAPSGSRLPKVFAAQVDAAFFPYSKFCLALRTETDDLVRIDLLSHEDEMKTALILALEKVWQEWTGTSAKTVGTGASKLSLGKFPFGDWVIDLCKEKGEVPPTLYAIRKAIKSARY